MNLSEPFCILLPRAQSKQQGNCMRPGLLLYLWLISMGLPLGAQNNLEYYLLQASRRNALLQNIGFQQEIVSLEIQKIQNQYQKPQWSLTGDYLLAPYFSNRGKAFAITSNPDAQAVGYDVGITNGGLYAGQLNVNMPLFTRRQRQPQLQQQHLLQQGLNNQYKLQQADLRRRITTDYLSAYLLQQQMDYTSELKERLLAQRDFVRQLTDRGIMRVTDLQLLTLEIKNQDYQWNTLEIQFRQAMQVLNNDAGIVDTSAVRLARVSLPQVVSGTTSLFLVQYELDSLSADIDQAVFETRYLPQVNVFANGGFNAIELNHIYRKVGVSAGIHFSWLLGDGGQRKLTAQQNKIRQLNARTQAQFARNQMNNARKNYAVILREKQQNLQLLNAQLENYQALLTSFRKEFAAGQLSVIDYLNVLRTYADLQQQKAQAETALLFIVNEINYWNH